MTSRQGEDVSLHDNLPHSPPPHPPTPPIPWCCGAGTWGGTQGGRVDTVEWLVCGGGSAWVCTDTGSAILGGRGLARGSVAPPHPPTPTYTHPNGAGGRG